MINAHAAAAGNINIVAENNKGRRENLNYYIFENPVLEKIGFFFVL